MDHSWQFVFSSSCREAEVESVRRISVRPEYDASKNAIPFVASIGRGLSIFMLLFERQGVPFLRLRIVPPSVVEERSRILYQLHVLVSVCTHLHGRKNECRLTHIQMQMTSKPLLVDCSH
jgi:hypothetical protein